MRTSRRSCAKDLRGVRKLLPYRQKIIHARWSGEACWIPLGDFKLDVGFENATSHPAPGEILFYPGGYSETEILFPYGSCGFASKLGQLAGNHFLTVVEGTRAAAHAGRDDPVAGRPGHRLCSGMSPSDD